MKRFVLKRDSAIKWSLDAEEMTLDELKSLLRQVWNAENRPEFFKVNNVTFSPKDNEVQIQQGYENIQWLIPFSYQGYPQRYTEVL